jgi:P4 family phage/plasmid primase-like protien
MDECPDVTLKLVGNVQNAMASMVFDNQQELPHWLVPHEHPASEYLVFPNGMLHVPTMEFSERNNDYFCTSVLPYKYDKDASTPEKFEEFVKGQLGEEFISIAYEMLGDVLMANPRLRVFYYLFGIPKGGKSTFIEVLCNLIGMDNYCAIKLANFSSTFGLEDVIGKKMLLLSEANADQRNWSNFIDVSKRITGNDPIQIERKYKKPLTVNLQSKIVMVSNHFLTLPDESGALFDRLIPIPFNNRIEPPYDPDYPKTFIPELPGILLKALEGYKRLKERKGFDLPQVSKDLLANFRECGSPVNNFLAEKYEPKSGEFISSANMFLAWKSYCDENDLPAGAAPAFVASVKSALPFLKPWQQQVDKVRQRGFLGLKAKP